MAKKQTITAITEWTTLHIFGYGETQINGDKSRKVKTSTLTKAQALIDFVYGKKPADSDAGVEFHAITVVKNIFGRYVPKNVEQKVFSIEYKDMDAKIIDELVAELQALPAPEVDNLGIPKV